MTRDSRRFLQPEEISRISRLEVRARQIVEGFLSGLHRSPYYGQSVEFVQHREYVPGDDFRRIDWKVWSKTDKYYIKQYEEDTNLRTLLHEEVLTRRFQSGRSLGMIRGNIELAAKLAAALQLVSPMLAATLSAWTEADTRLGSGADHTAVIRWLEGLQPPTEPAELEESALAQESS